MHDPSQKHDMLPETPESTLVMKKTEWEIFCSIFRNTSARAWLIGLSYTFSFSVVAVGILINLLNESPSVSSNNGSLTTAGNANASLTGTTLAASTLIMTLMNSIGFIFLATLLSIGSIAARYQGEIKALSKENEHLKSPEKLKEFNACEEEKENEEEEIKELQLAKISDNKISDNEIKIQDLQITIASLHYAGLTIGFFMLSPGAIIIAAYSGDILKAAGQSENIYETVQSFFQVYAAAFPGLFARISIEQIMFAYGGEAHAMFIGIPSFIIGTVLAVCLSQGYGLPKWGVPGVAAGYVVDAYLTPFAYGIYIARRPGLRELDFFNFLKVKSKIGGQIKKIFQTGWPISLSFLNEASVSIILTVFAARLGEVALADLNSDIQAFYFVLIFSTAFGQVSYLNMSTLFGAEKFKLANKQAKYDLITTAISMAPLCIIASIVLNQTEAYPSEIADILQILFGFAIFFDSLRYVTLTIQRAIDDNIPSTSISAAGLWLGLLVAGLLMLEANADVTFLGAGYVSGEALALIGLLIKCGIFTNPKHMKQRFTNLNSRNSACLNNGPSCCLRFLKNNKTYLINNDSQQEQEARATTEEHARELIEIRPE